MKITATEIANGFRFESADGFKVDVTSDQTYFTVRDSADEACGTIQRPRVYSKGGWSSYLPNGVACTQSAVGPRSAFRSFVMGYQR